MDKDWLIGGEKWFCFFETSSCVEEQVSFVRDKDGDAPVMVRHIFANHVGIMVDVNHDS